MPFIYNRDLVKMVSDAEENAMDARQKCLNSLYNLASLKFALLRGSMKTFMQDMSSIKLVNFEKPKRRSSILNTEEEEDDNAYIRDYIKLDLPRLRNLCTGSPSIEEAFHKGKISAGPMALMITEFFGADVALEESGIPIGLTMDVEVRKTLNLPSFDTSALSQDPAKINENLEKVKEYQKICQQYIEIMDELRRQASLLYNCLYNMEHSWFQPVQESLHKLVGSKHSMDKRMRNLVGQKTYSLDDMELIHNTVSMAQQVQMLIEANIIDRYGNFAMDVKRVISRVQKKMGSDISLPTPAVQQSILALEEKLKQSDEEYARYLKYKEEKAEKIRAAEEAVREEEESRRAEAARKAEEARRAEAIKKAEQARVLEEARQAIEAKKAAEKRKAEEAERAKLAAEQARQAEQERLAVERARQAEQERLAVEQARQAEQERLAAEQARKAEEKNRQAEQARKEWVAAEQARQSQSAAGIPSSAEQAEPPVLEIQQTAETKQDLPETDQIPHEQDASNRKQQEMDSVEAKNTEDSWKEQQEKARNTGISLKDIPELPRIVLWGLALALLLLSLWKLYSISVLSAVSLLVSAAVVSPLVMKYVHQLIKIGVALALFLLSFALPNQLIPIPHETGDNLVIAVQKLMDQRDQSKTNPVEQLDLNYLGTNMTKEKFEAKYQGYQEDYKGKQGMKPEEAEKVLQESLYNKKNLFANEELIDLSNGKKDPVPYQVIHVRTPSGKKLTMFIHADGKNYKVTITKQKEDTIKLTKKKVK